MNSKSILLRFACWYGRCLLEEASSLVIPSKGTPICHLVGYAFMKMFENVILHDKTFSAMVPSRKEIMFGLKLFFLLGIAAKNHYIRLDHICRMITIEAVCPALCLLCC